MNRLINAWNKLLNWNGNQISIRYYSQIYDDAYDEPTGLFLSGTIWTSGIFFPVEKGSDDQLLLEQGKINLDDNKLYVIGSLDFSNINDVTQVKIGLGSPGTNFYSLILPGTAKYTNREYEIYKKLYIRRLTNGSLIGEF